MDIRKMSFSQLLLTILLLGAMVAPMWPAAVHAATPAATPRKPGITEVVLAKQLDDSQKPVDPTDSFGPTDVFYCSVYVTNAQAGTAVSAQWYHADQMVDESKITLDRSGSGYVGFNLISSSGDWPIDDAYSIRISLDGKLVKTLNFSVVGDTAPVTSRIKSATLTHDVDENFRPTSPTLLFGTTDVIHCSVLADLASGANVTAQWYQDGVLLEDQVVTYSAKSNYQDLYIHFYLEPKDPFPAGSYAVEILLDGQLTRAVDFVVREGVTPPPQRTPVAKATPAATATPVAKATPTTKAAPTAKATATRVAKATPTAKPTATPTSPAVVEPTIGAITFATEVDADKKPVQPGTQFPAGAKTIYALFEYQGFMPGDAFEQIWYLDENETARGSFDWSESESGNYEGSLNNDQGLLSGNYRLEIQLNGATLGSGEFTIEPAVGPAVNETPTEAATETPAIEISEPTATLEPVPTDTPEPTATLEPIPTDTPEPTVTPVPSPTKPKVVGGAFKIAYTRTDNGVHSIWTMDMNGKGQKKIANYASDPAWSPDGKSLVIFGWDGDPRGGSGIYQLNADGTGARLIWNEGTASHLSWARSAPRWVAMSGLKGILVYDGKEGKWAAASPGEQPSLAPDGSRLVAHSCIGGDCGLYSMGRDGSGKRRITVSGDDFMPNWSPTGKSIAFARKQGNTWAVFTVNTDGSGAKQLTTDPSINAMPVWLPDGSGIVYRSTRGGSWGIWTMKADGTGQRKIADAPTAEDWGRDRIDVR